MSTSRTIVTTIRDAFTDPRIKVYRQHAQDTDQQLAALDDDHLDQLHDSARHAHRVTSSPTERVRITEFLGRLEQLMSHRAHGRPAQVALEAEDLVTAALMLQALGELLNDDELDVRGRTLRAAAALRAAVGGEATDRWHQEQACLDITRTLDRSRLD